MPERVKQLLIIVSASLVLVACQGLTGGKPGEEELTAEERAMTRTQGLEGAPEFQGHPLDDPASPLSQRVVYFDFDSSEIKPEDREIVEAHAQYLVDHPNATVVLEGHTDERGSREYNIALGERRAKAVRRFVGLLGASDMQIRTVSYGEERPAELGHDESAWQLNRRVEIDYTNR